MGYLEISTDNTGKMWWLENKNFTSTQHPAPSSRIGGQGRGEGFGYNSETLLVFDLSPLIGKKATSVQLMGTCDFFDNTRTSTRTAFLSVQNRTRHDFWDPTTPRYDDFGSFTVEWDTAVAQAPVEATGTTGMNPVFYNTAAFLAEIQKQIDGTPAEWGNGDTRDWRDGMIVRCPMGQWQYFNSYNKWRIGVNYADPVTSNNDYIYRQRRR